MAAMDDTLAAPRMDERGRDLKYRLDNAWFATSPCASFAATSSAIPAQSFELAPVVARAAADEGRDPRVGHESAGRGTGRFTHRALHPEHLP